MSGTGELIAHRLDLACTHREKGQVGSMLDRDCQVGAFFDRTAGTDVTVVGENGRSLFTEGLCNEATRLIFKLDDGPIRQIPAVAVED